MDLGKSTSRDMFLMTTHHDSLRMVFFSFRPWPMMGHSMESVEVSTVAIHVVAMSSSTALQVTVILETAHRQQHGGHNLGNMWLGDPYLCSDCWEDCGE